MSTAPSATPDPQTDAFLAGEGIPVPLARVETELARLWGPAAEREGGPDLENPNVTRLALANLVVCDLTTDGARTRDLIQHVTRLYPCRLIVLRPAFTHDDARHVTAEVSALCHLPAPGLPQVCAERIVLRAPHDALDLLPGSVRPLLETDLPLVLWWTGDPRPTGPLFRDLAAESSRLLIDLPDPASDPALLDIALAAEVHPYGRDLSWFGITPWRELLANLFDPPGRGDALADLRHVRIISAMPKPPDNDPSATDTPRVALWLAAWLAGQLGWARRARLSCGPVPYGAVFDGTRGGLAIEFISRIDPNARTPHLQSVRLDAGPAGQFEASRSGGSSEVRLETRLSPAASPLVQCVLAPEWDDARRLSAALESARDDPPYRAALPHLRWLLGLEPA
jgi:glucose-6-phosphate dehydrogenase assembly protein OpcA